jgi:phage gp36-like protein
MPYAVTADLETRFGAVEILQLADRDGSGVSDPGVVDAAIAAATVEIDGYLAVKYALPLAAIPPLVTQLACDIARYRLWKDRASPLVRQNYDDAVDQLKRLSSGAMRLTDVAGLEPAAGGAASVRVTTRPKIFDDTSLASY